MDAQNRIRDASRHELRNLSPSEFLAAWFAVSYSFPGLHPDDYDSPDSSWPENLKLFANEAWVRAEAGKLSDETLYPSDAQWAGIYDCLKNPAASETLRRNEIHMHYRMTMDY